MQGDFVKKIQVIDDCYTAKKRRDFIDGEKRAALLKKLFERRQFEPKRDDCGRVI